MFQKLSKKMIFVVIFMISLLHLVIAGLTDDVCTKVKNPGFCTTVVTNDPRSVTADLPTLAQIVMDEMIKNVSSVNDKLTTLVKENKDPSMGKTLTSCTVSYAAAYSDMTAVAQDMLKFKNYDAFSSKAVGVESLVKDCDSAFFVVTNSSSPSPVAAESQFIQDYADILDFIWSLLKVQNSPPPPSSSSGGDGISMSQNMKILAVIISGAVVHYLAAQLVSGCVGNSI